MISANCVSEETASLGKHCTADATRLQRKTTTKQRVEKRSGNVESGLGVQLDEDGDCDS